jgi:hypothetical protein
MSPSDSSWRSAPDTFWLASACLTAVAATSALVAMSSDAYVRVLGISSPMIPLLAVIALGFSAWILVSEAGWVPNRIGGCAGYRPAVLIGLALPIPVVAVDLLGGFGPDINARLPDALLFYPAIAVVAELVFHVVPLAVAAVVAKCSRNPERALLATGFAAAVVAEPALQVAWSIESAPAWVTTSVGVQLLAFNIVGVYLLRRFGVLRVLVYRLAYYLVWHVLWGAFRLSQFL